MDQRFMHAYDYVCAQVFRGYICLIDLLLDAAGEMPAKLKLSFLCPTPGERLFDTKYKYTGVSPPLAQSMRIYLHTCMGLICMDTMCMVEVDPTAAPLFRLVRPQGRFIAAVTRIALEQRPVAYM